MTTPRKCPSCSVIAVEAPHCPSPTCGWRKCGACKAAIDYRRGTLTGPDNLRVTFPADPKRGAE